MGAHGFHLSTSGRETSTRTKPRRSTASTNRWSRPRVTARTRPNSLSTRSATWRQTPTSSASTEPRQSKTSSSVELATRKSKPPQLQLAHSNFEQQISLDPKSGQQPLLLLLFRPPSYKPTFILPHR